jgi:hypothetical protein
MIAEKAAELIRQARPAMIRAPELASESAQRTSNA